MTLCATKCQSKVNIRLKGKNDVIKGALDNEIMCLHTYINTGTIDTSCNSVLWGRNLHMSTWSYFP